MKRERSDIAMLRLQQDVQDDVKLSTLPERIKYIFSNMVEGCFTVTQHANS